MKCQINSLPNNNEINWITGSWLETGTKSVWFGEKVCTFL